jgi:hypothetical protein
MGCFPDLRESLPIGRRVCWLVIAAAGLAGCETERPRSYSEYLDDAIAREATLLRCNAEREMSRGDAECINAKRAAAALAAQDDGDKHKRFEEQSERKREALRARIAARQAVEQRVQEDAKLRADAAYAQSWSYGNTAPAADRGTGDELDGGVAEPSVYTGQQFPAEPLQPGLSRAAPQPSPNEVVPYPGNQTTADYAQSAAADPYGVQSSGVTEGVPQESVPNQMLPDSAPSAPAIDHVATPVEVQNSGGADTADEQWQPFEPPPADQPADG